MDDNQRLLELLRRVEGAIGGEHPPRNVPPHGQTFLAGYSDALDAGDPSWYAITQGLGQAATIFILDLVEALQATADGAIGADEARFLASTLERRWQQETAAVHSALIEEAAIVRARQQQAH